MRMGTWRQYASFSSRSSAEYLTSRASSPPKLIPPVRTARTFLSFRAMPPFIADRGVADADGRRSARGLSAAVSCSGFEAPARADADATTSSVSRCAILSHDLSRLLAPSGAALAAWGGASPPPAAGAFPPSRSAASSRCLRSCNSFCFLRDSSSPGSIAGVPCAPGGPAPRAGRSLKSEILLRRRFPPFRGSSPFPRGWRCATTTAGASGTPRSLMFPLRGRMRILLRSKLRSRTPLQNAQA